MKKKMQALVTGIFGLGIAVCWLTALGLVTAALPAAAWKLFIWAWSL